MPIFLNIDLWGQCHSDTTANVEEFCSDALLPTYKQCDLAVLLGLAEDRPTEIYHNNSLKTKAC